MANSIKSVATTFLTYFGIIERICKFSVIVRLAAKNNKRCEHILQAVNTKAYPGRYSEDVCAGTKTSPAAQSFMLISAAVGQVIGILLYFALFPLIFCLAPGITAVVILESIVILIVIHYT